MRRVLVVANRTLCEPALLQAIRDVSLSTPVQLHLVVPASHPAGFWTDAQAELEAQERLVAIIGALDADGIQATGEIGDPSPVTAVIDVLRRDVPFDEVIVSTLPRGVSRWLSTNSVRRIAALGLPVTHVVAGEVRLEV